MGAHVHQVVLGVDPPSVGELDWHSCVCIWYILTWFFVMHFLFRWSSTLAGACFSCILCLRASCHDELSPTEVVLQDALLSIVLGVWHCKRGLNASVDLSLKLFHLLLSRVTIWRCSMFSRFLCCLLSALKHSGNFRFEQIETVFALLDEFHLLRGSPLLRLEPHAVGNEVSNSIEAAVSSPVK